jgi:CheY-like chemotaxis protein
MSGFILLIEGANATHEHATLLQRCGFRVEVSRRDASDAGEILRLAPVLIAVELESARTVETFEFARGLRAHPQLRATPILVYATVLNPEHIEMAARNGLLWLQITPVEKLVAAVRGLLSAQSASGAFE